MYYMPSLSMCFLITLKFYEICLTNYNHGVCLTRSLLPTVYLSRSYPFLPLTLKINMTRICITVLLYYSPLKLTLTIW